ncbi:MAG: efflux RND transporter periplasmic adaptor subunit [Sphingomonadales bacterium]|nr:MAG: efflux RND transporter periplasmic adaptor subunit [Sphingomonadales bacterium]
MLHSASQNRPHLRPAEALPQEEAYLSSKGGGKRRNLLIAGGLAAILAVGAGVMLSGKDEKPAVDPVASAQKHEQPLPRVSVARVGQSSVTTDIQITGTIEARNTLPIGVEGEGGRITAVYADVGDRVQAGQVLAQISVDVIAQQIAQMNASLDEARANASIAKGDADRAVSLKDRGALSQAEIDRRLATAKATAARANVMEAQLREMRARQARLSLRAPTAGVVLERKAEVGQIAGVGSGWLFTLAKDGAVEMRGQVAEQDLPSLRIGQGARVSITGSNREFAGKVWQLGAVINPETRLGAVRISLSPDPLLRPGAFAQAAIQADSVQRPIVPLSAVQADGGQSYVFVVGPENKIKRQDIEVARASSDGVVVDKGLSGGETIVLTAGAFLNAGEKIDPVLSGAENAATPTAAKKG